MEKYRQIASSLNKRIATGAYAPGKKMPSEKELANYFGVSVQTVNKAISILVSEATLDRKPGYGAYVVEDVDLDKLKESSEFRIGVLLDAPIRTITDADRVLAKIAFNLQHILTQGGFTWNVISRADGMDFRTFLPNLDGMILVGGAEPEDLSEIEAAGIPCVAFNRDYREYGISAVVISDDAVRTMAEHMTDAGFTRFLYVVNDYNKEVYDVREASYRRAVDSVGGTVERLVIPEADLRARRISSESVDVIRASDAAFLPHDSLAIAFIQSLEGTGIVVPDELAVFGYDNSIAGRHSGIPLSTIAYDQFEACSTIVHLLEGVFFRRSEPSLAVVDAWLILRESSERKKGA